LSRKSTEGGLAGSGASSYFTRGGLRFSGDVLRGRSQTSIQRRKNAEICD
jgi:hypothetical protein